MPSWLRKSLNGMISRRENSGDYELVNGRMVKTPNRIVWHSRKIHVCAHRGFLALPSGIGPGILWSGTDRPSHPGPAPVRTAAGRSRSFRERERDRPVRVGDDPRSSMAGGGRSVLHLEDGLDLDGDPAGQGGDPECAPCRLAGFSEDLDHQVGEAVDDLGVIDEVGRAVDQPEDLDQPDDLVERAELRPDGRQDRQPGLFGGGLAGLDVEPRAPASPDAGCRRGGAGRGPRRRAGSPGGRPADRSRRAWERGGG